MPVINSRLYIIDGNALLHRAWHAIPPLTTKDGTVVNAALGFAMVIDKLMEEMQPTHLVVCWDVAGGTFRDEVFEDYKAGRETKEQELYDQVDIIDEILTAWGIPSFGIEGYEADDLIGTIAEKVRKKDDTDTVIVTGDLDALQLVDESTEVLFFVTGLSKTKTYDIEAVNERYGFGPEHVVDFKALCGDSSDNIPGVRGVGKKTATDLIQKVGDVDAIYAALDAGELEGVVSPGVIKKLEVGREQAQMSEELATIVRDVPMTFRMSKAKIEEPDWDEVKRVYRELEFSNLLQRFEARGKIEKAAPKKDVKKSVASVVVDQDGSKVQEMLKAFDDAEKTYAVDVFEHEPDLFGSSITALALSDGEETYVFATPSKETVEQLAPFIGERSLIAHDLKRVMHALRPYGVSVSTRGTDLMVASYLVRAGSRKLDVDTVLADLVGTVAPDMPEDFSKDGAYEVLGQVVHHFPAAAKEVRERLKEADMESLYDTMEHPLISILAEMEFAGVALDTDALKVMSQDMEKVLNGLTKKIYKIAGREFNVNSPSQLAEVLFDDLGLPTKGIKKTKTGYSTAASELDKLEGESDLIPLIREYRETAKLKSTYVDALPELVGPNGRLHTSFNQTVAATGRLSSSDPNLQNIPIRTELGREVRKAFVAPSGYKLIAIDYSQIELRLVAALSKDKRMMEVFKTGGDIHTSTAAAVFDVAEDKVTKGQRRAAKAVNFGIIYGMGPRALARSIDVSFSEAKEFIDTYFATFPAVRKYLDRSLEEAQEKGYAETIYGRRRLLPDLESGVQMVRAAAERMATNMPLQGTAADVIKNAMVDIQPWLKDTYGDDARMILQVHDELVFEVKDSLVEAVGKEAAERMQAIADVGVPLTVSVEVGQNWKDVK